jgi:hypothetical protein
MNRNMRAAAFAAAVMALLIAFGAAGCDALKRRGEGKACGGKSGIKCAGELRCDVEAGRCGEEGLEGVCVSLETICDRKFEPVCGCDGRTYLNDCNRVFSNVQKAHDGKCGE